MMTVAHVLNEIRWRIRELDSRLIETHRREFHHGLTSKCSASSCARLLLSIETLEDLLREIEGREAIMRGDAA